MDPDTLRHIEQFFATHGLSHVRVGVRRINICDQFSCVRCILHSPHTICCPIRYAGTYGHLPMNYLPYIQQRYPELFI